MSQHRDGRITYLGRTTFRNTNKVFGIRQRDRFTHMYVLGKTGMGKSTLLRNMALQDAAAGVGFALFDPHGDVAREMESLLPEKSRASFTYVDVPNPLLPWRFNPFSGIAPADHALAAASLVEVFKKMWPDEWGPRLEHVIRNVIFTLLEMPDASLADIPPLLADKEFRKDIVRNLNNTVVKEFWLNEYDRYSHAFRAVVIAPVQNKVGALLTDPTVRRFLTEPGMQLDLRRIMDDGKVLLVNLDKGQVGEGPAVAIGSFLVSHLSIAGISRSNVAEGKREDFIIYLDEFHTFTTLSLATMLAELRKYRVAMVLANQYLGQLEPAIRDAVFGNVGSILCFRIGGQDAGFLAKEFAPTFSAEDFIRITRHRMYLRLMIDGQMSEPFSAGTVATLDNLFG